MKLALSLAIVTFFAQTPTPLQEMVQTEQAFARMAAEKTVYDAFITFIADDGLLFRPEAVNGKKWLLDHPAPVVRKLGGDREMTIMRKDLDVDFFQIRCSGRVQRRPIHVEHRTVARAIPTCLKTVPVQMTSDMSTGRRTEMHGPVAVAIGRQLLEPLP